MPVTPNFSEDFYKSIGHKAAEELVNWFDQAHTAARADLKELNELNYARFEAKLEQRIVELRATFREELASLAHSLRQEWAGRETRLRDEIRGAERSLDKRITALEAEVGSLKNLIKWLFGFWAASTVTILAAIIRLAGS